MISATRSHKVKLVNVRRDTDELQANTANLKDIVCGNSVREEKCLRTEFLWKSVRGNV